MGVGRNVGAGMTGGLGYFLDEEGNFPEKVNSEIVSVQRVITDAGAAQLRSLIEQHVARTGSPKGQRVLDNFDDYLPKFWQVVPPSEADCPEASDASPSDVAEEKACPRRRGEKGDRSISNVASIFRADKFFSCHRHAQRHARNCASARVACARRGRMRDASPVPSFFRPLNIDNY